MTSEVRMPQLGMNQERAAILAWRARIGDRVEEGDILYEVETDKAAMEIEAGKAGYLAEIRAAVGEEIPVGEVIAVIVEKEGDVPARAENRDTDPGPGTHRPTEAPSEPTIAVPAQEQGRGHTARVLASPKARRLAARRGIDLAALRDRGVQEPIHEADLPAMATSRQSALEARVDGDAFNALLARSSTTSRTHLLAAFAASAWRARFAAGEVSVALLDIDGSEAVLANPDQAGRGVAGVPALTLIDLGETRLTSCRLARNGVTLGVGRDGAVLVLTLTFDGEVLPLPDAIALLDAVAARVEDPIRQLL